MRVYKYSIILVITMCIAACTEPEVSVNNISKTIITTDWTDATHSKLDNPNFDVVFPNTEVLRIDITLDPESWTNMQLDLIDNLDVSGNESEFTDVNFTPLWVPASVKFNGIEWYAVGIRYKGNSSLGAAFQKGSTKYPFKLDFDEFEDVYPEIKNQRFYGFKQLNLSSNFKDDSFMREKVAADLFRESDVPAAHTAFAAVYLDLGKGLNYVGLYTLVEEIDDTVIDFQFTNGEGNLYKPEGIGASFAEGTFNMDQMNKKSNEDAADFRDVKSLYDILHSSSRTSNIDQWKTDLESVFNVDQYLKYLAVNNTIQNWDSYGKTAHNYFLYNSDHKLTWIPWDHNETFSDGQFGGAVSLSMSEIGTDWPIMNYIISIDEYETIYKSYLNEFTDQIFEPTKMSTLYSDYRILIQNYATQETSNFDPSVEQLNKHALERYQAVQDFLN